MLRDPLRDPLAFSILSSEKIRRIQNFSGLRAPKKAPESKTLWSTSMNERIQKLAEQQGLTGPNYFLSSQELENFAELIVGECIITVKKRYMGDKNREDMEVRRCVEDLKKHFEMED